MNDSKFISETFADNIHSIGFKNGIIRLDFVSFSASENDEDEIAFLNRVTIPLEGFLNTFHSMENILEKLRENGLINKISEQTQDSKEITHEESPNFK